VVLTVTDEQGNVIRRLNGPTAAGFQRITWDLRYPPATPVTTVAPPPANPDAGDEEGGGFRPAGPMVPPSTY